ncbi:hypothetical protein ON010_g13148 [Phytophthora cinnamomi]|nr:hypothetical protein ON010_g13148 [Phytophthora cinnamomi]
MLEQDPRGAKRTRALMWNTAAQQLQHFAIRIRVRLCVTSRCQYGDGKEVAQETLPGQRPVRDAGHQRQAVPALQDRAAHTLFARELDPEDRRARVTAIARHAQPLPEPDLLHRKPRTPQAANALKSNYLTSAKDIAHILELPSLSVLDIQSNRINDVDIVDILAQLPNLKVLYLQGNEVVKHIKQYRKTLVYRCRKLKYLDDRPVFDDERRRVEAWGKALEASNGDMKAAQEAERQEMDTIRREKKERDEQNFLYFEQMMIEGRRKRREEEERKCKEAQNPESEEQPTEEINPFSGEKIVPVQDCAFLQQEREKRWEAVVNAPDEHDFSGNNATNENNQDIDCEGSLPSNESTPTGAIPVDERRMEVLHQCATVGAGDSSGKDPFVNSSFQISQAGSGSIGELSAAPVCPVDSSGIQAASVRLETQSEGIAQTIETQSVEIPQAMLAPPPAPIAISPRDLPVTTSTSEESEFRLPKMVQQNSTPAIQATDSSTNSLSPPPPPVLETEQATLVLPPPPPPTHTNVNELD